MSTTPYEPDENPDVVPSGAPAEDPGVGPGGDAPAEPDPLEPLPEEDGEAR